jgi:hypothetical protein
VVINKLDTKRNPGDDDYDDLDNLKNMDKLMTKSNPTSKKNSLANRSDTNLTKSTAAIHNNNGGGGGGDGSSIRLSLSDLRSDSSIDRYKNNILNYYFNDKIYQIDEDENAAANANNSTHRIKRTPRDSLADTPALRNVSTSRTEYADVEKVTPRGKTTGEKLSFDDNFMEEDPLMDDSFINELRKAEKKKEQQTSSTGAIGGNIVADKQRVNSLPGAEKKDKIEEFFIGKNPKVGSSLNMKAAPPPPTTNTNSSFTSMNSLNSNPNSHQQQQHNDYNTVQNMYFNFLRKIFFFAMRVFFSFGMGRGGSDGVPFDSAF